MSDLSKISATQAVQGEKIENIQSDCEEIKHCLLGNGRPGLVLRTDRLEQKDQAMKKVMWITITAVVVVFIKTSWPSIVSLLMKGA